MRIRRLDLLRYGHLADIGLEFPADVALHVVHGANEAGKSTALAAISDALFGFGHRTDYDFRHGGSQLRIGFTLVAEDGTEGTFVRRKGRTNTLTDPSGEPVPDVALRRFLGGIDQKAFEQGFGLNAARLRAGSDALLSSDGEAGESLLAGAGQMNLRAALASLDEEARTLVGDGRGKRRLSEAAEAWRQAQRATDEAAIAPRAWQDAEASHAAIVAELTRVQAETRELHAENSRLQRLRRVFHELNALAVARERLADLKDVPDLPHDAAERRDTAEAARREAERDAKREREEAVRLTAERDALPRDAAVLAARDAIGALAERRPVALLAGTDLPKVRASAAAHRARVADAMRDLGQDLAPEAARDAVPRAGIRTAVQRLIAAHAGLTAKSAAAADALAAARRRRDRAAEAVEAAPPAPAPDLLRRKIETVRAEGRLDTLYDQATRTAAAAERAAASALAALPLWTGDLAALAACPIPLPAQAEAAGARLAETEKTLGDARAAIARLTEELAAVEAKIALLSLGEVVPTPDAVAAARDARDRAWGHLRSALVAGTAPVGASAIDGFEDLRDEADRLADRRADEATRVADYLGATAQRDALRRQLVAAEATLAEAGAMAAGAAAAWKALWAPAGIVPAPPAAMVEWRRLRDDVLKAADRAAEGCQRRDECGVRRDRARAALGGDPAGTETLETLVLRAETDCAAAEAAAAAHRRRLETLAHEDAQLPELLAAAETAAAALDGWAAQWAEAVAAFGLPRDSTPAVAEAALAAWTRIAEAAPAWRSDSDRVAQMTATLAAFARDADEVRTTLGEPDRGAPAEAVAAQAVRRLAAALAAEQTAAELTTRIAAHLLAADTATRRRDEAEAALAALRAAAGVDDDAALWRVIEQFQQRIQAEADIATLKRGLASHDDGVPEAVLRAEATATDPDGAAARLAEINDRLDALGSQRESLSADLARAETTLADMRRGNDAASKAQDARDALAHALAAAERYARLHVARELLRAGIDRYRREQQDPLLKAASAHFSLLTGDRYRRLGVDEDSSGRKSLSAVDGAGGACPVAGLSEGARDQLYLALRVAAIEAHVSRAEPLPFVADDLLVTFDDTRAAAALRLLGELGRQTQVILFTHHDHIAAMAERQPGAAVLRLPGITT